MYKYVRENLEYIEDVVDSLNNITEERIEVNGVSFSYRDDNYYGYCFFMDSTKNILDEENEFIIEYVYDKFYETNIICFIYKSASR